MSNLFYITSSTLNNDRTIFAVSVLCLLVMMIVFTIFAVVYICAKDSEIRMLVIILGFIIISSLALCAVYRYVVNTDLSYNYELRKEI